MPSTVESLPLLNVEEGLGGSSPRPVFNPRLNKVLRSALVRDVKPRGEKADSQTLSGAFGAFADSGSGPKVPPSRDGSEVSTSLPELDLTQAVANKRHQDFGCSYVTPYHGSSAAAAAASDIVQFSAAIYYAEEAEGVVFVDIMRLGTLEGAASVRWETKDGSAEADVLYKAAAGEVVFHAGEHLKTIEIVLVQNPAWAPTLEFQILLSCTNNCELGRSLHTARVKVINADIFPTNKYADLIVEGPDGIERIPQLNLLIEFIRMNLEIPGVVRKTVLSLVLDQMANIYFYFTLNVTMYITDVLFAQNPQSVSFLPGLHTSLFVPGDPESSAMILAALYVLPMVPIHWWDYASISVDLKGTLRNSLRASLYRKYLNYTEDSRRVVQAADMQAALLEDVVEASQCYTYMVELLRIIIRLVIVVSFTLHKSPQSWWILVLMPSLMFCWVYLRGPMYLNACDAEGDSKLKVAKFIHMTCGSYNLISEYYQRPLMNELFEQELWTSTRRGRIPKQQIEMNNKYFTKWLGPAFVGLYISTAARQVLQRDLSVGQFLATINILRSIASDFGECYRVMMSLNVLVGPLRGLVNMFNMPIEVPRQKAADKVRRELTKQSRACVAGMTRNWAVEDGIPLQLVKMSFQFSPERTFMSNLSLTVPQGSTIAVLSGDEGAKGRSTLLRLLGQRIFPTEGNVFVPTHLRVLHVAYQPMMVGAGLWQNIVFGAKDASQDRVLAILSDLHMHEAMRELKENPNSDCQAWHDRFPYSELAMVHLARAFVMSAEVTVFQRPLAHFSNLETRRLVLKLIHELSGNRGVRLPPETAHRRRPRTCFFTPETQSEAQHADIIWTMNFDRTISVRKGGVRQAPPTGAEPPAKLPAKSP